MYLLKRFFILENYVAILTFSFILRKMKMGKCLKVFLSIFFRRLHCSNGTKRGLDAAAILVELCTRKNSCKISTSLIFFLTFVST